MIKIVFLGTNGWYDTKTGNTICILIETRNEYIVLDAGNGISKLADYAKAAKPVFLFLSHFHLDHVVGLHTLDKFTPQKRLTICIPKGTHHLLKTLASKDFTLPLDQLPFSLRVVEIAEGRRYFGFLEKARKLRHPVACLGFRLKLDGKIITYISDTGPCAALSELAKNADLLISECAQKPGRTSPVWPHLDPVKAAQLAKKSQAGRLILVHFDANAYKTMGERLIAQRQARKIFPKTIAAKDGLELAI